MDITIKTVHNLKYFLNLQLDYKRNNKHACLEIFRQNEDLYYFIYFRSWYVIFFINICASVM